MRGFFLRGAGVGASPVNHEGIGVEFNEAVSAGSCVFGFFGFPRPIIALFLFPEVTVRHWVNLYVSIVKSREF
jgi:hypothetical protein